MNTMTAYAPSSTKRIRNRRRAENSFPSKLYQMLECVETQGLSAAVTWLPNGSGFIVQDEELFVSKVLPKYFKATKIRSFQRQLLMYGFHRIITGPNDSAWWHESFVRGRKEDLKELVPIRGKSTNLDNSLRFSEKDGTNTNERNEFQRLGLQEYSSACYTDRGANPLFTEDIAHLPLLVSPAPGLTNVVHRQEEIKLNQACGTCSPSNGTNVLGSNSKMPNMAQKNILNMSAPINRTIQNCKIYQEEANLKQSLSLMKNWDKGVRFKPDCGGVDDGCDGYDNKDDYALDEFSEFIDKNIQLT